MPKKRAQIAMTEDEMWAFIEDQKSLQVATINSDGSPHLTTLWFAVVGKSIVFETFTKSQKIVNLQRDPRIAVLLEDGDEYNKLRGVTINAVAEIHSDPEMVQELAQHVVRRNQNVPEDELDAAAAGLASKRSAVVINLEKVLTWDHRKLEGKR